MALALGSLYYFPYLRLPCGGDYLVRRRANFAFRLASAIGPDSSLCSDESPLMISVFSFPSFVVSRF
jgi:hypothetical protein